MSPDPHYNPFNNPEFRKEMSEMFDDKLQQFGDLDRRLKALERWRWYLGGSIVTAVGAVKLWLVGGK
jgi:hypothetical protein